MHELSLCEGILQIFESEAEKQNFKKIKMVWLEIGELSSVDINAMLFCFDVVMQNSIAKNAKLEIIKIAGTAWCIQCNQSVKIKNRFDECPQCGSSQLQVTGGEEMKIKELEVD